MPSSLSLSIFLLSLSLLLPLSLPFSPSPSPNVGPTDPVTVSPLLSTLSTILTTLGYHTLSLSLSTAPLPPLTTPLTVFAPSDSSLATCPSCSLPLLLQQHSLPGLYPSSYLLSLPFHSLLHTLLPSHCLTLTSTSSPSPRRLFVSGVEVTSPDLFTSPHLIIHGLTGYLTPLSPYSCGTDTMTSLSLSPPASSLTRMMLADAMIRLRTSGYSILALAIRVKYNELVSLHNMTIFAVDDTAIFHGGHAYVNSVRFHIVPNVLLRYSDLERLPSLTVLPTMEVGESLTVTSAGGGVDSGNVVAPMRINYVRVKFPDLIYNMKLVVHGLSSPFPRISHAVSSSSVSDASVQTKVGSDETVLQQVSTTPSPPPPTTPAVDVDVDESNPTSTITSNTPVGGDFADYAHHGL